MKKCLRLILFAVFLSFAFNTSSFAEIDLEHVLEKSFVFPYSLQVIEEEAFGGTAATNLIFGHSLTIIRDRAFADMLELRTAYLPQNIRFISGNAFQGSPKLYILGTKESYSEGWAKKHKIPFRSIDIWLDTISCCVEKGLSEHNYSINNIQISVVKERRLLSIRRHHGRIRNMRPQEREELHAIDNRFP